MQKMRINRKALIVTLAAAVVTVAIAVPIGVVFGTKKDKYEKKEITTELQVGYGTTYAELASGLLAKPGLTAVLDASGTTYKEDSILGTTNLTIAFYYNLNGDDLSAKPVHVLYKNVTVVKGLIVAADVKQSDRKSTRNVGHGQLPSEPGQLIINGVTENTKEFPPITLRKYKPWTFVSYTTVPVAPSTTTTNLTENDVKALAIGSSFIAVFTTQPDDNYQVKDNESSLMNVTNKITYTVVKATAKVPPAASSKDFHFGPTWSTGAAWPMPADLPTLSGYNAWGVPTLKKGQTTLNDLTTLALNDLFTATFKASLDSTLYAGQQEVTHVITYTAKKGTADAFTGVTESKEYKYAANALPLEGKPAQVLGYNPWSVPTYRSKDGLTVYPTLNELKVLPLDTEFTATYATSLDSSRFESTTLIITKVVNFKVIKNEAATYTDPLLVANFTFGTNTLPLDGLPTAAEQVEGYSAWSTTAVYTSLDGLTTYANGAALATIPANSQFVATYTATLNPNYNSTITSIQKIVRFTVQPIAAATFSETTKSADYIFDDPLPTPPKPAVVSGYGAWSDAVFSVVNFAGVNALNVGATFTATFEALLDSNYTGAAKITQVITYTVRTATAATLSQSEPQFSIYEYDSTELPAPSAPALIKGYTWGTINYSITFAQAQSLVPGNKFLGTFTGTLKPNYVGVATIQYNIEFNVVRASTARYTDVIENADYIYNSNVLPTPTTPANVKGFTWGVADVPTLATIQALNAGATFDVIFTGTLKDWYLLLSGQTAPIQHKIVYTVKPTAAPAYTDSPETGNYTYGTSSFPATTVPANVTGYTWSTSPTFVDTIEEVSSYVVGQTFNATYTGTPQPNYTGLPITHVITFTVVAATAGTYTGPSALTSTVSKATITSLPLYTPLPTLATGYNQWASTPQYSTNGDTVSKIKALNVGDTFTATYTSNRNFNYTGGPATLTLVVTYTVQA